MVVAAALILGAVWYCSSWASRFETVSVNSIPETQLTIFEEESKLYDSDGVTIITYFNLFNAKGDTLASICSDYNPYANSRGLVYIPKKGVFDCRGNNFSCVLSADKIGNKSLCLISVEGKDEVVIEVGSAYLSLKEMSWTDAGIQRYVYDLNSQILSNQQ